MSEYKLTEEIMARSEAKTWSEAKLEWELRQIWDEEEPDTCLCGHYPIREICEITNIRNGNAAQVGNCCVKKFLGLPSGKLFEAIKRVRKHIDKSLNESMVNWGFERRWISQWEHEFYLDILGKRRLSDKQIEIKRKINEKILSQVVRNRSRATELAALFSTAITARQAPSEEE
jgi:hypothetical protein